MFKTVVLITLCVTVLAHKDQTPHQPGPPDSPPSERKQASSVDSPHIRVARQMPSMPGGMNPAQFPSMMADMAKQGFGAASKVMDPNTWMNGMSQMSKTMPQMGE